MLISLDSHHPSVESQNWSWAGQIHCRQYFLVFVLGIMCCLSVRYNIVVEKKKNEKNFQLKTRAMQ